MTSDRRSEIERICHAALDRDGAARDDWLTAACGGDETLRREVEELLSHSQAADHFMQEPALEVVARRLVGVTSARAGGQIGPYQVVSLLGSGGMGEVYRARDRHLGRDVAIKVLPDLWLADPDRRARFDREARVLASLNHPHIAAIYGVVEVDEVHAIVLELVEGPTLAERIAAGPLPIEEACAIATEIAEALEAAHARGIVHCDIKPANIKVTSDGVVKVLDFGLAMAMPAGEAGPDPAHVPSANTDDTRMVAIFGTFAYMSPEQVRGKPIDKRTDIWAFGCVFYEMLTGVKAVRSDDINSTTAGSVHAGPEWRKLPVETPAAVRRLLRRCLETDRKQRLPDIGIARLEIDDAVKERTDTVALVESNGSRPPDWRRHGGWAWPIAAVSVIAALAFALVVALRRPPMADRVYRTSILPPANVIGGSVVPGDRAGRLAISPDGRRLAFTAPDSKGRVVLWVRPLDGLDAQPLAGTEGAAAPFWSPDGGVLAFVADGKLKRVDASGGPVQTLCDPALALPGAWNKDDVILFTPTLVSPLSRVAAAGGTPTPVTSLDTKAGEARHAYPFFLPDGRHFLFLASNGSPSPLGIYVGSLDSRNRTRLVEGGSNAQFALGFVIYLRGTTLMAQPFDATRLVLTGSAVPVAEQILSNGISHVGAFAVSETGGLAYLTLSTVSSLVWFGRDGRRLGVVGDRAAYFNVALSPDGRQASAGVSESGAASDIWVFDVATGLRTRFTFNPADEFYAIWSGDGTRMLFDSNRLGHLDLYQKASTGAGDEQLLLEDNTDKVPQSWSLDGRYILYTVASATTGLDLWVLPLSGDLKPFPFLRTPTTEGRAQFSPDGHWVAYASSNTGRNEVYVAAFPSAVPRYQISTVGGDLPRWSRDGKELYYVQGTNKMMAMAVVTDGNRFEPTPARPLFDMQIPYGVTGWDFDVSQDGQRFLVNTVEEQNAPPPITLVVNWTAAIKK